MLTNPCQLGKDTIVAEGRRCKQRGGLRRQRFDQPGAELKDERGIDRVDDAVAAGVGVGRAGQRSEQPGAPLEDERGVDGVDVAVTVRVAYQRCR